MKMIIALIDRYLNTNIRVGRMLGATAATLLACSLLACSGKSRNADAQAEEVTDSVEVAEVAPEPPRLPDTAYQSVKQIDYNVSVIDSEIDPRISSLRDLYADVPGAFTFRNGMERHANFGGTVQGTPTAVEVVWTFETVYRGTWGGGSGWTGQPLYVEWPDSIATAMKNSGMLEADASGREIMVGSLCGKVYFIDFVTGKASRKSIEVDNPIKGTMSLDPTLNGNLYVGQGVPDKRPFGALCINLFKNEVTHMFPEDPKAGRNWGAYDSSPLRLGQYLFRPGENGTLYKWLVCENGTLKLQSTLRYKVGGAAPGMEASMAIYGNYGYTGDNHGTILCVNLDTMKPVWVYKLGDDIDSSIVLEVEDGVPYIYTGCEIDRQKEGDARYVKINALNGEVVWTLKVPGRQRNEDKKHFDGGFYATALPGTGNCSHLLFVNCVLNNTGSNGVFMAIDRRNGEIAYQTPTRMYAWSSPVGFTNEAGEMFVVTGDCAGNIYLINGIDGKIICRERVGNNFESSPVVVGNELVVGSRGEKIFKIRVK